MSGLSEKEKGRLGLALLWIVMFPFWLAVMVWEKAKALFGGSTP